MNESKKARGNTWETQISDDGEFVRRPAIFRGWVTADGSNGFKAESGRYHLYVSYACPWAHRTLIARKLKGLEEAISYDVVDHLLTDRGWTLTASSPDATRDTVNGATELRQLYSKADSTYAGSITVPVLWDKQTETIVNNESSEILRMFNAEFQDFATRAEVDLYPAEFRGEIDSLNEWIYDQINNGVYRAGFARSQRAYDRAVSRLFEGLDRVEEILSRRRYLTGSKLTEADVRLFTTLVRFDAVYVTHFKCNVRRIVDSPNTWGYVRDIYALPGVAETVNLFHIKHHYFESHRSLNPTGIVPAGPEIGFAAPHDRARLG